MEKRTILIKKRTVNLPEPISEPKKVEKGKKKVKKILVPGSKRFIKNELRATKADAILGNTLWVADHGRMRAGVIVAVLSRKIKLEMSDDKSIRSITVFQVFRSPLPWRV